MAVNPPRANFYIDGFNLYRGCLEKSTYKWLDLVALADRLAVGHTVKRVRYFTAHVEDPAANKRQLVYLRALSTLTRLHVDATGTFTTHTVIRPLADTPAKSMAAVLESQQGGVWLPLPRPAPGYRVRASVRHKTEKGSDVNLATHLLADAFVADMDAAWVISGDSDLETPIRLVNTDLIPVHVINPTSNRPSAQLQAAARTYASLAGSDLAASQLPDPVMDRFGKPIHKPPTW
jgi:uncharacterized LabA/DUF88 family protein